MDLNTSILIVSAYGRGHWLASELKKENIPVTVIDVSSKLGLCPPEDIEGPFGFFKSETSEEAESLQTERVNSGDEFKELPHGLTLWLADGPLELRGPFAHHRFKKLHQSADVLESLDSTKAQSKNPSGLRKWASDHFKNSWLLSLAHQWSATTYHPNARGTLFGKSVCLMDRFLVRRATAEGLQKGTAWLRSKDVEVLEHTEILDLSFKTKKVISGIELHGERSGVVQVEQLVWMLNSEESYFIYPKIAHYLFPEGELEPEWCWVRYRLQLAACPERDSLPAHTLVMEQVTAPWAHQNLLVLLKAEVEGKQGQFDAWIRIPNVQRFNKEYLRIRGENILNILRKRMPLANPTIESFPQEFYFTHSQIGPSRFPVYGAGLDSRRNRKSFSNLWVDGSEVWRNFSWDEMFETQGNLRQSLIKWWKLLQQKKEKESRD